MAQPLHQSLAVSTLGGANCSQLIQASLPRLSLHCLRLRTHPTCKLRPLQVLRMNCEVCIPVSVCELVGFLDVRVLSLKKMQKAPLPSHREPGVGHTGART